MRYLALASDYDGTLAHHGAVDEPTLGAVRRLRDSGRKFILVTGRELGDLLNVFPGIELCDRVVAENGALIYNPETKEIRTLGEPPPEHFVHALARRGVDPVSVGRVIVATWEPHEKAVLETIRDLELELQVIFNKGAVMILPTGVNKATGLRAALDDLGLSPHNVVAVGDAENDHAFFAICEASAAVANSVPALKERADLVTAGHHGEGVSGLIDAMIATDLQELAADLERHRLALGVTEDGRELAVEPHGVSLMLAGPSESGKSTLATAFIERLAERKRQFCIVDPEGDYETFESAVPLGDGRQPPSIDDVMAVLQEPSRNVSVNLLAIAQKERPTFFSALLARIVALRTATGRPHWLILDEAHHLLPASPHRPGQTLTSAIVNALLVTLHPSDVESSVLQRLDGLVVVGEGAGDRIRDLAAAVAADVPAAGVGDLPRGEAAWASGKHGWRPLRFRPREPASTRRRHQRKYAEGDLGLDRSFFFRGPRNVLRLRAGNLGVFLELSEGVDDETWRFHLERGDYSRWLREGVKDSPLAEEVGAIEANAAGFSEEESRRRVRDAIEARYGTGEPLRRGAEG